MSPTLGLVAILATSVATVLVGVIGIRAARTTSDFYVASRTVTPWWNASAIGGEYLSAASFLGVAGLILAYGADMLWFPVGYTAFRMMDQLGAGPARALRMHDPASGRWLTVQTGAGGRLVGADFPIPRIAVVLVDMQTAVEGWIPE